MYKKKKKKPLQTRKQRNEQYQKNNLMRELKLTEDVPVRRLWSKSIPWTEQDKGIKFTLNQKGNGEWGRRKLFWVLSSSMSPLDISEQISALAHRFCSTLRHGFWSWWLLEKWWLEPVQACWVAQVSGLVQYRDARLLPSLLPAVIPTPRPLLPNDENAFRRGDFTVEWIGSIMSRVIAMDQLKNILFALNPSRKGQGLLLLCKNSLPFSEIQRMPVLPRCEMTNQGWMR